MNHHTTICGIEKVIESHTNSTKNKLCSDCSRCCSRHQIQMLSSFQIGIQMCVAMVFRLKAQEEGTAFFKPGHQWSVFFLTLRYEWKALNRSLYLFFYLCSFSVLFLWKILKGSKSKCHITEWNVLLSELSVG